MHIQFCRYTLMLVLIAAVVSCSDSDNPVVPSSPLPEVNGWQPQEAPIGGVGLTAIQFVNRRTGWIVGYSGTILHTTDGGQNWRTQRSGTDGYLLDMHFADRYRGWAVGQEGIILRTTDGGAFWQKQSSGTTDMLLSINFIDEQVGWITGLGGDNEGRLLRTEDAGETWVALEVGKWRPLNLTFVNRWDGWGLNGVRQVISTSDGGQSWEMVADLDITFVRDLQFFDESNGVAICATDRKLDNGAVALHDVMLRTSDGGSTWEEIYQKHGSAFQGKLYMDKGPAGWVVSHTGIIEHTTDSGQTWQRQYYDPGTTLIDMFFLNSEVGWVVGYRGTILHTTNGGL